MKTEKQQRAGDEEIAFSIFCFTFFPTSPLSMGAGEERRGKAGEKSCLTNVNVGSEPSVCYRYLNTSNPFSLVPFVEETPRLGASLLCSS